MLSNYQINKLDIEYPAFTNFLIILVMVCIALALMRRDYKTSTPLSIIQTGQLKGMAILMVILGHLWVHVSKINIALVLSGEAVALFLLLSGYGLTVSETKKARDIRQFFIKRFRRVMIPYWCSSVLLLALDFFILGKMYSPKDLLMTSIGININTATKHMDYVRWYITFIIIWYIIFFFTTKIKKRINKVIYLFVCGCAAFILSYYILHFGWYQFFAFPMGCTIAIYYNEIKNRLDTLDSVCLPIGIGAVVASLIYKYAMFDDIIFRFIDNRLPSIFLTAMNDINSIVFCLGIIIVIIYMDKKNLYSRFLFFCGTISYELFLLHGAFLIKYNPVIKQTTPIALSMGFTIFLIIIIMVSFIFSKIVNSIWR